MSLTSLNIEKREKKGNLNILRSEGKVPAIIYGNNKNPELITVNVKELTKEYKKPGYYNRVIQLKNAKDSVDVLAKDIQLDPIRDVPIHADFMRVSKTQRIRVQVPIHYENAEKSPAIKRGSVLNIIHHSLEVSCSPYEIPEFLRYDLKDLKVNDSIHLDQLELPKGITPVHPERDHVLATVVAPTTEKEGEAATDKEGETADTATGSNAKKDS